MNKFAITLILSVLLLGQSGYAVMTMAPVGDTNNTWADFSFWTGARISNPYVVSGTNLVSEGTTSDAYIEISLSTRYVLRSGPEATDPLWGCCPCRKTQEGHIQFVNPFIRLPDMEGRVGYVFRDSTAPTNYNASAVIGSADFYAEYTLGLPIVRYSSEGGLWKNQWTIELSGGFATDEEALDLHPSAFFGVGWQTSSQLKGSTNRFYWLGRVGVSLIDQPEFVPGTSQVVLNSLQEPNYDEEWVPSMGAMIVYPITSSINLQAGLNAYFTSDPPSSWNASLGVSLDLDKFFAAFK